MIDFWRYERLNAISFNDVVATALCRRGVGSHACETPRHSEAATKYMRCIVATALCRRAGGITRRETPRQTEAAKTKIIADLEVAFLLVASSSHLPAAPVPGRQAPRLVAAPAVAAAAVAAAVVAVETARPAFFLLGRALHLQLLRQTEA